MQDDGNFPFLETTSKYMDALSHTETATRCGHKSMPGHKRKFLEDNCASLDQVDGTGWLCKP
jgi:hypothetical protein